MRPFVIVGGTSVPTGRTGKASGLKSLPHGLQDHPHRIIIHANIALALVRSRGCRRWCGDGLRSIRIRGLRLYWRP
jgi:hypothetical protein